VLFLGDLGVGEELLVDPGILYIILLHFFLNL
jgi:hypothetical protein